MSGGAERGRGWLVAGSCLGLLLFTGYVASRDAPVPPTASVPSLEELDSLRRYLAPAAEAPRLDDYGVYLPAEAPPPERVAAAEADPGEEPALTAILISGEHPVAIIDDRPLRRGERLAGGAEVVTIARDHVVIRETGGALRTLRLPG